MEEEVSETAGVGGAVMSECGDKGVLAPPAVSSPSFFLLLFVGLSSVVMSEYICSREAGLPAAHGKDEGGGFKGEEEDESCSKWWHWG